MFDFSAAWISLEQCQQLKNSAITSADHFQATLDTNAVGRTAPTESKAHSQWDLYWLGITTMIQADHLCKARLKAESEPQNTMPIGEEHRDEQDGRVRVRKRLANDPIYRDKQESVLDILCDEAYQAISNLEKWHTLWVPQNAPRHQLEEEANFFKKDGIVP